MIIPAEYRQRILSVKPDLLLKQVEYNQEGLVNDIVIVNRQRVFRFAKTEWAGDLLQEEARMLALAQQHSDIPLPVFDLLERDLASYPYLSGNPLLRDDLHLLPLARRQELAEKLGRLLYRLHHLPLAELQAQDIPPSVTNRSRSDWLQLYEQVQRQIVPLLMADAREWVRRLFKPLLLDERFMDGRLAFVNGDLAPYHILFDPGTQQISGLLDFGTAGVGDPAVDLACLINSYGETFLHWMLPAYPDLPDLIERARFWSGTLELQWLLGGLRSSDPSWFAVHIGRARDVWPLGSGWPGG